MGFINVILKILFVGAAIYAGIVGFLLGVAFLMVRLSAGA